MSYALSTLFPEAPIWLLGIAVILPIIVAFAGGYLVGRLHAKT